MRPGCPAASRWAPRVVVPVPAVPPNKGTHRDDDRHDHLSATRRALRGDPHRPHRGRRHLPCLEHWRRRAGAAPTAALRRGAAIARTGLTSRARHDGTTYAVALADLLSFRPASSGSSRRLPAPAETQAVNSSSRARRAVAQHVLDGRNGLDRAPRRRPARPVGAPASPRGGRGREGRERWPRTRPSSARGPPESPERRRRPARLNPAASANRQSILTSCICSTVAHRVDSSRGEQTTTASA